MHRWLRKGLTAAVLTAGLAAPALAGIVVYEKDDKKVEIGARIQLQYLREDPDGGSSTDRVFFRRLRPFIAGTVTKNWAGKVQIDFGEADDDDEVKVKDAYMQYLGLARHEIFIGNTQTPFSREFLTSSERQQFVERMIVGDHNFGVPDRQLGVRLDGHTESKKLSYSACVGQEQHDPDPTKLDFDTPATNQSDWNDGRILAGRVDFHPLGYMKFDQADFRTDSWKLTVGVSGFTWSNDNDNNTTLFDLDSADGVEVSGGVRGHGFSADGAYQVISAETVDTAFTGGIYLNGSTELNTLGVKGGYMFPGVSLEVVAGWQSLDADNYAEKFDRTSLGLNYYFNEHNAKLQLTYQMDASIGGVDGADEDLLFAQAQFVF